MIFFEDVTKEFPNKTVALYNASFHIEPGEFVLIVGPSGAGKTTILRLLLKEIEPSQGTIHIDNQELSSLKKQKLPELRRKIGAVFQDYKLILDRTIEENIALVSEILKMDKEKINQHVNDILEKVALEEKGELFPSQLSGGELQRSAIARAIASEPLILFADEPTGNLDLATGWEIINLLLKINKSGTTVIVATHNQEIVKSLNKRIIELEKGRIIKDTKEKAKSPKSKQKLEEKEAAEPEEKNKKEEPLKTQKKEKNQTKENKEK